MEPCAEPESIVLKPFLETATYRNVLATRAAVVNLIDDVRVFAKAAISNRRIRPFPRRPFAVSFWLTRVRGASSR